MKVKVKYVGKAKFISGGLEFTKGGLYTIEDTLYNAYKAKFELVAEPKAVEKPAPVEPKAVEKPKPTKATKED